MSDTLQLSGELIQKVQDLLTEVDPKAQQPIVAVQYLSAITGFMVAQMPESVNERKEYLKQLSEFTESVFVDVESRKQTAPPPQDASGVWRPGEN
ncbi:MULTISPECIES: hypothetical protein [Thioalkalivibrio]|uniref:Uncharacterized protein n=1 Tax=Thioalkalivibrio versutus TaxID=106634 RepID=A0A0G3G3U8_9GAMM|nr:MULTISPECIES: hypothetical protein [Thioalkalivibrio]AKJ95898.1 hypothetical protein TVD_11275 [Thioalkalivibrio versutus]